MEKIRDLMTENEIKVFSDPYRLKIIKTIREMGRSATVKEIADKMEEVPAKVHYHLKKLEKIEVLKLDYTREINGIIAKYYKLTADSFRINYEGIDEKFGNEILNTAEMVLFNLVDEFKRDIKMATTLENPNKTNGGIVTQEYVYFSDEEYAQFEKELKTLLDKYEHHQKEEGKSKYSLFVGFLKIAEAQKEIKKGKKSKK